MFSARYDDQDRVVLEAGPSAVTGYSEGYGDLVGYSSGNALYLSDSSGLFTAYEYGSSTTATTAAAGDVLGFLKSVSIRRGETGPAVPQESTAYIANTVGSTDFYHLASETVYRNDDGTGGRTTGYSYWSVIWLLGNRWLAPNNGS